MNDYATAWRNRSGFTLVELLVVIAIIGVLAALIVPAVFQARISAKNAAIKAEIDMLHMAIMNYKNEYGSFPPGDSDSDPQTGDTRLRSHVQKVMPRADLKPYAWEHSSNPYRPSVLNKAHLDQFFVNHNSDGFDNDNDGLVDGSDPDEVDHYLSINFSSAIPFVLSGYRKDPIKPLRPFGDRKSLFDFDDTRIDAGSGAYHPSGKPNSPYIYIDFANYRYDHDGNPATPEVLQPFTVGGNTYTADPNANPNTFQILCAGQDEIWNTPDDLSNFWKGAREDQ
jgi:prepilin-type N-terminal cleavage/methylation domain-containing protein